MSIEKIAVIGAGNGGHAMSAHLSLLGYSVNLYELPQFKENLRPILKRGGVEISGDAIQGFAELNKVTTDIEEAITGVSHIMIVTQALGHKLIAELCAPYLEDGQLIYLFPGSVGSIEFAKILKDRKVKEEVVISEAATLPYACRVTGPAKVNVHGVAEKNFVAAFPAKYNGKAINGLKKIYNVVPGPNVIWIGFANSNIIYHPPGTLLNIGRIEYSKGEFWMYKEGMTPSVWKVITQMDDERKSLLMALGTEPTPISEIDRMMGEEYSPGGKSVASSAKGPSSSRHRYVNEDVPVGLVFMSSLGDMIGVPTPTIKSIIQLASVMNEVDYAKEGRTVERLGLAGLTTDELRTTLADGYIR